MAQIFAYIGHKNGTVDDAALELISAAKKIDAGAEVNAIVVGSGVDAVCEQMAASFKEVWKIDKAELDYPNAEIIRGMLVNALPGDAVLLMAHDTFSMDLAPGLSIKMDSAYAADAVDFEGTEGDILKVVRQEFGGQVNTHVTCDISGGAILTVRPGSFEPDESKSAGGSVVDKTADAGDVTAKRKFLEIVEAEVGDVDITKSDVLVSIGRGIEDEENIELAQELADAMGAVVSCSRPIVDAKWLEKSRQVGTSGQTVKPNVYLALGISGSFQHLGGIKGGYMIAVNKNPKAPIFQVADVGVVADILELIPELTEKVKEA
ncbi:MAG: electron transfer flavoprotein subunit alpha/FixB family protein [Desulfosudaceae bacterium]